MSGIDEELRPEPDLAEPSPSALPSRPIADAAPSPARASPEAVRDLALALRSSVETMHGVKDLQEELVRTLKRQDRSELVLQSTQSLNEAFRNLSSIQRELLTRLEEGRKARGGSGRLVPILLLALLAVFLGGTYVVLTVVERSRTGSAGAAAESPDVAARLLDAFKDGKAEGTKNADQRLQELQSLLQQKGAQVDAARKESEAEHKRRLDADDARRSAEAERDDLASQIRAAQAEAIARRTVEDELKEATTKLAVMEPRLRSLEGDYQAAKSENARLRQKLGADAMGLPEPPEAALPAGGPSPGAAEAGPPPAGTGGPKPAPAEARAAGDAPPGVAESPPGPPPAWSPALPGTSPSTPPPQPPPPATSPAPVRAPNEDAPAVQVPAVERDTRLLARVRQRVNELLEAGGDKDGDLWQVMKIGGISGDRLVEITAMRYDRPSGRLLETVQSDDLRIQVRPGASDQEKGAPETKLVFSGGTLERNGATAPLVGTLDAVVARGAMAKLWSASGFQFVQTR